MKNLFYVQVIRIKGLFFLHQAPGDNEEFGCQLYPNVA
jgi:hypothetical protein